jgi:hypothetical protein
LAKKKFEPLPARVTPAEKQDVIHRLERRIATVNHRYAFQIKHGGTVEKKRRTNNEIKMLENERKSVNRMQPLPGHVKRAERD